MSTFMETGNHSLLSWSFAEWVWGGGTKQAHTSNDTTATTATIMSPEICVADFPLGMPYDCWIQLAVKLMGVILIAASFLIKTPIIRNMVRAQSAAGISRTAVYGETIVYANSAFYGYLRGLPLTAYGEYLALVAQSLTIVGMTWWFSSGGDDDNATAITATTVAATDNSNKVTTLEQSCAIGVALTYVIVATRFLPPPYYFCLTSSTLPILLYARGSQIMKTHKSKHTGALSIVSTSMSLGGALTRVFTTIKEVGYDFGLLVPFFLGLFLNSIVFSQYLMYYNNTQQFLERLRIEKEQKKKKQ